MQYRIAKMEDLEAVQKLNLMLFEKEYEEYDKLLNLDWTFGEIGTNIFRNRITSDDSFVILAEEDGKIVGYLCGGMTKGERYRKMPKTAELENTFVLPEYRSKGLGTEMYRRFVEWCDKKQVKKIRVEVTAVNHAAINFYHKNGFKDYTLILEHDL